MPKRSHVRAWMHAVFVLVVIAFTGSAAFAVPPASGLGLANGYGIVSWERVAPTPAEAAAGIVVCYRFKVTNTQQPLANPAQYRPLSSLPPTGPVQGFGIKGLVVYHPVAPVGISDVDRANETLYQSKSQYSWWDHNGSEDRDNNGLQDRFTEPQEINTGSNSGYSDRENLYRLCYTREIDPSQYQIGLHVVEPFSGKTFFAYGDRPSLSITKSANTPCVASGSPVTYSFVVKNTGTVPVSNILVIDDELGLIGTINSLAPSATQTLTKSAILTQTTTIFARTEGAVSTVPVSATSNPVTVEVMHPGMEVTLTASESAVCAGDPVTFTAHVKNTGDVPLTNVVLQFSDNVNISVGALNVNQVAGPFTRTIPLPTSHPAGQAFSLTITAAGKARVCAVERSVGAEASAEVEVEPCAEIRGRVQCLYSEKAVAGATVRLWNGVSLTQSVTSGADGAFAFASPLADGTYTVEVIATDYQGYVTPPFSHLHSGSDLLLPIGLTPLPISYVAHEQLFGRVYFSDVQAFRNRAVLNAGQPVTIGETDLYNPLYASPNSSQSYRYVGSIPGFPGHYGGIGEPEVWVIIQEPLLAQDNWTGYSFTNLIAVEDGIGTGAGRPRSTYSGTTLFSHPFTGPGTAHQYTVTALEVYSTPSDGSQAADPMAYWNTPAHLVQIAPSSVASPLPGEVPPGWMAQTLFRWRFKPGNFVVFANGTYRNACGGEFPFRLHPDGEAP